MAERPKTYLSASVFNFRLRETLKGEGPLLADRVAELLRQKGVAGEITRIPAFVSSAAEAAAHSGKESNRLAVFGSIDEFHYGGITTESKATVTMTAADAQSGGTIWTGTRTLSEPPKVPKEKFFALDSGRSAPMPMDLANRLAEGLVVEFKEFLDKR